MHRPLVALALATALNGCAPAPADDMPDTALPVSAAPTYAPYAADGRTVERLDPARYLGLWYEIATTGSFQQQTCVGTTATYSPIDDDTIEVYNRCLRGDFDGSPSEITGTATATDATFTRLLVDFGFGFEAPYDVVELDGSEGEDPYAFAGVSSFEGAQLWILARTPTLDAEIYDALVARFEERGYADPAGRLVRTAQQAR
jgi:apolipoprotein D and lipocalin family protein